MPDDFPVKSHQGFDAGKSVDVLNALHPGDTLTAKSEIHDIYEKTGRSGGMLFVVHRMRFSNETAKSVELSWLLAVGRANTID